MWKSVIRDYPEEQDEWGNINPQFVEWVETFMMEPWMVALQDLVSKWPKIWTGTEKQLMEELRFRVNREVWESEDFPSDFDKLRHYYRIAIELAGCTADGILNLVIFRYEELSKEDLKEFYAPGWGPQAPILLERDLAARPEYSEAMIKLVKYEDPLLLAFLIFTASTKFSRNKRKWFGSTNELAEVLTAYYPKPGLNCYLFFDQFEWAPGEGDTAFFGHSSRKLIEDVYLFGPSDYRRFYARMKTYAHILENVGIKVSKRKVTRSVREPGGEVRKTKTTRWCVEGPRWNF
jgi:hypothetical protein